MWSDTRDTLRFRKAKLIAGDIKEEPMNDPQNRSLNITLDCFQIHNFSRDSAAKRVLAGQQQTQDWLLFAAKCRILTRIETII